MTPFLRALLGVRFHRYGLVEFHISVRLKPFICCKRLQHLGPIARPKRGSKANKLWMCRKGARPCKKHEENSAVFTGIPQALRLLPAFALPSGQKHLIRPLLNSSFLCGCVCELSIVVRTVVAIGSVTKADPCVSE